MVIIQGVLAIVIGYVLGSIPSAYLAGRLFKGIDIRKVGGHNMGALNTAREVSPWAGLMVLIADMAKGALAVLIARWLDLSLPFLMAAGFAAVIGHNWPAFLGFRGGKGAATAIGVFFALVPLEMAMSLGLIIIIIVITSNFRLAMAMGLALLPVLIWQLNVSGMLIAYSVALFVFLGIRSVPTTREAIAGPKRKKSLIFDRDYHFWQTRKSK
jgi:glycerol-3-phosphate acyltransferase PlsY